MKKHILGILFLIIGIGIGHRANAQGEKSDFSVESIDLISLQDGAKQLVVRIMVNTSDFVSYPSLKISMNGKLLIENSMDRYGLTKGVNTFDFATELKELPSTFSAEVLLKDGMNNKEWTLAYESAKKVSPPKVNLDGDIIRLMNFQYDAAKASYKIVLQNTGEQLSYPCVWVSYKGKIVAGAEGKACAKQWVQNERLNIVLATKEKKVLKGVEIHVLDLLSGAKTVVSY